MGIAAQTTNFSCASSFVVCIWVDNLFPLLLLLILSSFVSGNVLLVFLLLRVFTFLFFLQTVHYRYLYAVRLPCYPEKDDWMGKWVGGCRCLRYKKENVTSSNSNFYSFFWNATANNKAICFVLSTTFTLYVRNVYFLLFFIIRILVSISFWRRRKGIFKLCTVFGIQMTWILII